MRFKYLAVPGYLIAALMVVIPIVETALGVLPIRAADVTWRVGALGLMSRSILTPIIAMLGALVLATVLEQRGVQRGISIAAGVLATLILIIAVVFSIDVVQMAATIRPEGKPALKFAATEALVKYVLFTIALLTLARAAWKASATSRSAAPKAKTAMPMVGRV